MLNPFHVRGDLKVRAVPLERIAESVRPGTALVAVSAAQSADGRIADLAALREAAREHGARTYVDVSQAAGWLPVSADAYDFAASVGLQVAALPARRGLPRRPGGPRRPDARSSRAGWRARSPGTAATARWPNSPAPHGGST